MDSVRSLADYKKRPHTQNIDFGDVTVKQLVASICEYRSKLDDTETKPEDAALQFYCMNAAAATISHKVELHQPLPVTMDAALEQYYGAMRDIGLRAFFYTFLICTREARHGGYGNVLAWFKENGWGNVDFFKKIPDSADQIFTHLTHNPPNYTVKRFCELLVLCFEKATYGGGYGGPAWAAVARPLRDFANGKITMEMFLDTVWTLAHNNGPIFNKGMLFGHYNSTELTRILDVQRAGMIPNLIEHNGTKYVEDHHRSFVKLVRMFDPEFGVSQVDWQKVQDLGAKGHYVTPTPKPPKPSVKMDPNQFEIMPKVFVQKMGRKAFKQKHG